jgi:hypothetical protein
MAQSAFCPRGASIARRHFVQWHAFNAPADKITARYEPLLFRSSPDKTDRPMTAAMITKNRKGDCLKQSPIR